MSHFLRNKENNDDNNDNENKKIVAQSAQVCITRQQIFFLFLVQACSAKISHAFSFWPFFTSFFVCVYKNWVYAYFENSLGGFYWQMTVKLFIVLKLLCSKAESAHWACACVEEEILGNASQRYNFGGLLKRLFIPYK